MDGNQLQRKIENAVSSMMEEIEKKKIRPIYQAAYAAMSQCYADKNAGGQQIENCLNQQASFIQAAQHIIQSEINSIQDRLNRCTLACQDEIRDRFPGDKVNSTAAQQAMMSCASNCVDKHIALLKSIQPKLEKQFDDLSIQQNKK